MEISGTEEWELWPEQYNTPGDGRELILRASPVGGGGAQSGLFRLGAVARLYPVAGAALLTHEQHDVKLMGDIPIGISYSSADVFFEPQWFDLSLIRRIASGDRIQGRCLCLPVGSELGDSHLPLGCAGGKMIFPGGAAGLKS